VRFNLVQVVGKCHKKYRMWPLMAFSCSGPVQSLEKLSRKDYVDTTGGRWKGRILEDVAVPRLHPGSVGYARDGFVSQRREPPIPPEARRIVKAGETPDHDELAEPYPAAEKLVVKTVTPSATNGGLTISPAYTSRRDWHRKLRAEAKRLRVAALTDVKPQTQVAPKFNDGLTAFVAR